MENFNNLEQMLEKSKKIARGVYLIGLRGSLNKWSRDREGYESFQSRKLESERKVEADALCYYDFGTIVWKTIYRNTKGLYIKANKQIIYLVEEPLPDAINQPVPRKKPSEEKKILVSMIKEFTNNFTTGFDATTLMGWFPNFDGEGRPLNADPNHQWGKIEVNGKPIWIVKCGWKVGISLKPMDRFYDEGLFYTVVDLTPKHLKDGKN